VAAKKVLDWMSATGFRWWQLLPLSIPDSTGSPYASPSAHAWSYHLISQQWIIDRGWADKLSRSSARLSRREVDRHQRSFLIQAAERFFSQLSKKSSTNNSFERFCQRERKWLESYTWFMALRDRFQDRSWWTWPSPYRTYTGAQGADDVRLAHRRRIHAWIQWVAQEQWLELRSYAKQRGIGLIGDVPFFVRADSVDVWADPELYTISPNGRLERGSGAPPDAFTSHGQWWGNPGYHWARHQSTSYAWWRQRLLLASQRYDALRLDHFHGYLRTWMIDARKQDARRGNWQQTPRGLLSIVHDLPCPVIAEDLGAQYPPTERARHQLKVLGTRVWEFGWSGFPNNPHFPDHITSDVAYISSNHDLPPLRQWWTDHARVAERRLVIEVTKRKKFDPKDVVNDILISPARLALFTIQDLTGHGSAINTPGQRRGNWRWQAQATDFSTLQAKQLRAVLQQARR